MELADIMALVKAGYTRNEIEQMEQAQTAVPNTEQLPTPDDTPTPTLEPTPTQVVEPAPAPAPTPTPVQEEAQPSIADIMQSIAKLTSAVQANAIAQSVIPQGLTNPPSAEDMLAEIIRPTYKERS